MATTNYSLTVESEKVRELEILVELDLLDRSIIELDEEVSKLINHLEPIISSEKEDQIILPNSSTVTAMGGRLNTLSSKVTNAIIRLKDVENRLEL